MIRKLKKQQSLNNFVFYTSLLIGNIRMKLTQKYRILAILLSLALISSTLGINVYSHICHSQDRVDVSIFQSQSTEDCSYCQSKENTCCIETKKCCETTKSEKEKSCCEHKSEFVKLDFDTINYDKISIDLIKFVISENLFTYLVKSPDLSYLFKPDRHFSGISPPFSKSFLHFISLMIE